MALLFFLFVLLSTRTTGLPTVPIWYRGGFDAIPGDKIKTQMESDTVQPCKLCFGEPEIGGQVGTAAGGGEDETEKKRSKVGKTPAARKRSARGWD